jgi:hypothetical protein
MKRKQRANENAIVLAANQGLTAINLAVSMILKITASYENTRFFKLTKLRQKIAFI